jgi:hypothetical protein
MLAVLSCAASPRPLAGHETCLAVELGECTMWSMARSNLASILHGLGMVGHRIQQSILGLRITDSSDRECYSRSNPIAPCRKCILLDGYSHSPTVESSK